MGIWVSLASPELTPPTELMTSDLTCPSTYQLLQSSPGCSGPNMSFDMPASLEYLSILARASLAESSLAEQNRNPSSPKRVHFINLIIIQNKEDEAKEEGNVKTITTEYEDHEMTMESKEEFKE
ncbi:hypothetical protein Tco_1156037 [Tanacetum coccineum]